MNTHQKLSQKQTKITKKTQWFSAFVAFVAFCLISPLFGQTTQVLFPINTLFGGAAYNRPITLTAANTLISDGQNLWAGTYTIIPASTTNPVISLYPDTYLLTVAGVVKPARLTVPLSTNVLNAASLITSGPLFYFGTNGMINLWPGENVTFVTNIDGSITINMNGAGGSTGTATNLDGMATNQVIALALAQAQSVAATNGGNTNALTAAQQAVLNAALTNNQTGNVTLQGALSIGTAGVGFSPGSGVSYLAPNGTLIADTNGNLTSSGTVTAKAVGGGITNQVIGLIGAYAVTNQPGMYAEQFGAVGDGSTDDTAALQSAINFCEANGDSLLLSSRTYKITKELLITNALSIVGSGFSTLGSNYLSATSTDSEALPNAYPYFSGCIIRQATAGSNILHSTAIAKSLNVFHVALMFDYPIAFNNSGHGIFCDPPQAGPLGKDLGPLYSHWSDVFVWGVDALHEGFWIINGLYNQCDHLACAGGGGFCFEGEAANSGLIPGNMTITESTFTGITRAANGDEIHAATNCPPVFWIKTTNATVIAHIQCERMQACAFLYAQIYQDHCTFVPIFGSVATNNWPSPAAFPNTLYDSTFSTEAFENGGGDGGYTYFPTTMGQGVTFNKMSCNYPLGNDFNPIVSLQIAGGYSVFPTFMEDAITWGAHAQVPLAIRLLDGTRVAAQEFSSNSTVSVQSAGLGGWAWDVTDTNTFTGRTNVASLSQSGVLSVPALAGGVTNQVISLIGVYGSSPTSGITALMATGIVQSLTATVPYATNSGTAALAGNLQTVNTNNINTNNASQLTSGTVSPSLLPLATTSTYGAVKADGTTITVAGGVISSSASSGTATNLAGMATNQVNALALAQAQSVAATNLPASAWAWETSDENVGASLVNSSYLTVTVPAGNYYLKANIVMFTTNNDGLKIYLSLNPAANHPWLGNFSAGYIAGAGSANGGSSGWVSASASSVNGNYNECFVNNTTGQAFVYGMFQATNTTTITLQWQSANSDTITIKSGSCLNVTP